MGTVPICYKCSMETVDRMLATMRAAFGAMGRGDARWVDRDGVGALVTPYVPNRSVVNCVIYTRGSDVEGVYDELEEEFAEVDAWTVWVPDGDSELAAFLETRGHKLDADPAMMVLDLPSYNPTLPVAEWQPATVEE